MKSLILHIGQHKTGTKTVQHLLYTNQGRLAEAGILYPNAGLRYSQHMDYAMALFGEHPFMTERPEDFEVLFARLIEETAGASRVILSSEAFWEIYLRSRSRFAEILAVFREAFDVRLVMAVRDANDQAWSALKHYWREGFPRQPRHHG